MGLKTGPYEREERRVWSAKQVRGGKKNQCVSAREGIPTIPESEERKGEHWEKHFLKNVLKRNL